MDGTKKRWQKPELTILVRSNPEEAVLTFCKYPGRHDPQGNECSTTQGGTGPQDCVNLGNT
jgi:hypothetical protein